MKFDIRTKLTLGYMLVITIMSLFTIGAHISANQRITQAQLKAARYQDAKNLTINFLVEMRSEELALQYFLIDGDQQQLEMFLRSQKLARQYFNEIELMFARDDKMLASIDALLGSGLDYLDNLATKLNNPNERRLLQRGTLRDDLKFGFQNMGAFFNELELLHGQAMISLEAVSRQSSKIIFMLVLVLTALAIVVGYLITRRITASLRILIKGIRAASEGNYGVIEGIRTGDEIGEVVAAFNQMVTTIQSHEVDLQEKNEELLAQGEELSTQNEEILAQQEELQQAISSLTQQEELLSRFYRFSQSLTQTIEMDHLVEIAFNGILGEAEAQVGAFLLYNPQTEGLKVKTMVGLSREELSSEFKLDDSLPGRAARERRPLIVGYHEGQLRSRGLRGELVMSSEIYLPLIFHGDLLGMIILGRIGKKEFSVEEQKRLASLTDQTSVALHNSLTHLEIRQALKRVQEVDQLKSELINTVSHELRTPLASIFGFAELLLKKPPEPMKAQKYLTTIYKESLRLTGLINNFLDLQRIENGCFEFIKKSVDLAELIKTSVETYQAQSSSHTLSIKLESNLPPIMTDPDRVTQVLGNLLSNAIKYSPAGGLIEISASRCSTQAVEIAVKDGGLGIPAEAVPHLFRPFFRVDNSDRRQIGGTGLGLAICQKIIRTLGGDIGVRSEYGKGSTFFFRLPFREDKPIALTEAAAAAEPRFILVIEDDPTMAELVAESLSLAGYRTELADNGPAALAFIQHQLPSVIILDLILSGALDGWEFLKKLKLNALTAGIPVIISSVLDQRRTGLEFGVADYLIKPFSPEKLVDSVNRVTGIAAGVIGLPGNNHPTVERLMVDLLEDKGFAVKDLFKEDDLLVVILDNPAICDKE